VITMNNDKKILRVFPRRTNATPDDELVRFGEPGLFDPPDCDEVHISVTFSWDLQLAHKLYSAWKDTHPVVKIGGPALDNSVGEFEPGKYLKTGNVITSRGCPNNCWFCVVPRREGSTIRELQIHNGWKVHDSNLLACSRSHIEKVLSMLDGQKHRPIFVGGLEATRLEDWHIKALREVKADRIYCAYDTPDDLTPLRNAGRLLQEAGFTRSHHLYAYVLIGYPNDDFDKAKRRLQNTWDAGFTPYAMLYRDPNNLNEKYDLKWKRFQREWVIPAIVRSKMRGIENEQ